MDSDFDFDLLAFAVSVALGDFQEVEGKVQQPLGGVDLLQLEGHLVFQRLEAGAGEVGLAHSLGLANLDFVHPVNGTQGVKLSEQVVNQLHNSLLLDLNDLVEVHHVAEDD